MTHYYASGPFGDRDMIVASTAPVYDSFGIPAELSRNHTMHPLLDALVFEALLAGDDTIDLEGDNAQALIPVSGDHGPARWFDRSHPLDEFIPESFGIVDRYVIGDPSPELRDHIERAVTLLEETLPDVWENTLPFAARAFGSTDPNLAGVTVNDVQSALVLGEEQNTKDVWRTAANLFHEVLHCKSYLLYRGFDKPESSSSNEFIDVPWWRTADGGKKLWEVHRAIDASHVYSHLAVFFGRLVDTGDWPAEVAKMRQRAAFRARFLTNVLLQLGDEFVDPQRREFVTWIAEGIPDVGRMNEAGLAALRTRVEDFEVAPALV